MDKKTLIMFGACLLVGLLLAAKSCGAQEPELVAGPVFDRLVKENLDAIRKRQADDQTATVAEFGKLRDWLERNQPEAFDAGPIKTRLDRIAELLEREREPLNLGPFKESIIKLRESNGGLLSELVEARKEARDSRLQTLKYQQEARAERRENRNLGARLVWFAGCLAVVVGIVVALLFGLVWSFLKLKKQLAI